MVTTQPGQGDAHANVDQIGDAFQLLQDQLDLALFE
jgi:hypothetical protein